MKGKERGIGFGWNEADGASMGGEALKPCSWSLLEPIERFLEAAYMCRIARIDEARWLLAIDLLSEITMKESIFDI
jgi:hypothetical protein